MMLTAQLDAFSHLPASVCLTELSAPQKTMTTL